MKILWTFDPFEKNKQLHEFGKNLVQHLFDKKDSIETLYVASNAEAQLATAFNIPAKRRYSSYPKELIKEELKKWGLSGQKVEVLEESSLSLTTSVKKVVEYSKKKKADLVLISSNGKEVLPRMIFGSFAETLVHLSVCDLLVFHQKTKFELRKPQNILYAHDFSTKGNSGLERVLTYVKKWNATLTLVYVPVPDVGQDLHDFKQSVQKRVQKMEKSLEAQKIKFTVHLEYGVLPISEIILTIAEKSHVDIIAVAAKSNKLAALFGGSVSRQVMRESLLPTLVLKV